MEGNVNTCFKRTVKSLGIFSVLTVALLALAIGGCGPSEKQLKEEAERKAKEAETAQIEVLKSKVLELSYDPASAQFRNLKLLHDANGLCGEVNAKNLVGGYVGFKPFAVASGGPAVVLISFPVAEVINLSKKTKEERKQYIHKMLLELSMQGQREMALKMFVDLDSMEKFSHWGECFN